MEFHEVTFVRPVAQLSQAAGAQRVSGWVVGRGVSNESQCCLPAGGHPFCFLREIPTSAVKLQLDFYIFLLLFSSDGAC